MAFVCTAQRPDSFQQVVKHEAGQWYVIVSIGYDPDGPLTYYFVIHTYPSEGTTEFAFCVVIRNNRTHEEETQYDSAITNAIIDTACRRHIVSILVHYSGELIASSRPKSFFMETFSANLPDRALVKYALLRQVFAALGYTATSQPAPPGKHRWVLA